MTGPAGAASKALPGASGVVYGLIRSESCSRNLSIRAVAKSFFSFSHSLPFCCCIHLRLVVSTGLISFSRTPRSSQSNAKPM